MILHFVKAECCRQEIQWLSCIFRKVFLCILPSCANGHNTNFFLFHKFHNTFSLLISYLLYMPVCKVLISHWTGQSICIAHYHDDIFLHSRKLNSGQFFYFLKSLLFDVEIFLFGFRLQCCRVLNFCNSKLHKNLLQLLVFRSAEWNIFYFLFLVSLMPYYIIFVLQS